MNKWIFKKELNIPKGTHLQEIIDQIKDNSNQSIDLDKFLKPIIQIIFKLDNNPNKIKLGNSWYKNV